MPQNIHPTAIIGKNVKLGDNISIGPYCIINDDVEIGDNTELKNNVTIESYSIIGKSNKIFPFAVIGGLPQDLKFGGEVSQVIIGDNNVIREFVTINRGTKHGGKITRVGSNNLFMANSHIAHDCQVGSNIVIANSTALAGHVEVQDNAILGGLSAIHQFVRIGRFSIIGGMTRVPKDVLPFVSVAWREKTKLYGPNKIGLMRHGFSDDDRMTIQKITKLIMSESYNIIQALEIIRKQFGDNKLAQEIIEFIEKSKRGILR